MGDSRCAGAQQNCCIRAPRLLDSCGTIGSVASFRTVRTWPLVKRMHVLFEALYSETSRKREISGTYRSFIIRLQGPMVGEPEGSLRLGERGAGSPENLGWIPNTYPTLGSKFPKK